MRIDFFNPRSILVFVRILRGLIFAGLLGIAFDCGFNSKATFNRAFKKCTGRAPKEFQESLLAAK